MVFWVGGFLGGSPSLDSLPFRPYESRLHAEYSVLLEAVELLQHMVMEVALLVLRRKLAPWKLEDLWELELPHSQYQLLEVLVVEQEDSHLRLLEVPSSGSACSEDRVELVVVEEALLSVVLVVLLLAVEGLETVDEEDVLELLWLQVVEVEVAVGYHLYQSLEARLLK